MSEAQQPFTFEISEDKKSVKVTWSQPEIVLTASDAEKLATAIGLLRSALHPSVPALVPEDVQSVVFQHFDYITALHKKDGKQIPVESGAYLAMRSGLFGWFDYYLDPEYCKGLVLWLQGQGNQLSAPQGTTFQ